MFLYITSSGISSLQLKIVMRSRCFRYSCLEEEIWGGSLEKEKEGVEETNARVKRSDKSDFNVEDKFC